jgi:hypothetical protein
LWNSKYSGDIRLGYGIEIFNSRGAHFVDPEGKPERELANHYRKQAQEAELDGLPSASDCAQRSGGVYDREAELIP